MNRRGLGFGFCAVAAFLYAVNYLAACLFWMPQFKNWDPGKLSLAYKYVGRDLQHVAIVALIIGIVYLVLAEVRENRNTDKS